MNLSKQLKTIGDQLGAQLAQRAQGLAQQPVIQSAVGAARRAVTAAHDSFTSRPKSGDLLGAQLRRQLAYFPMLDLATGNAAYSLKLGPVPAGIPAELERFHKFGIFFEAESKMAFQGSAADQDAMAEALLTQLNAALEEGLSALLPAGKAGAFGKMTVKMDRPKDTGGTNFRDLYWDDKNGTLAKLGASIRERTIEGGVGGKFESKLPGALLANSLVLGRFELARSTLSMTPAEMVAMAKDPEADNSANPIWYLKQAVPELDLDSLCPREELNDTRNQFVVVDEAGNDLFLITRDHVHAELVTEDGTRTGKTGSYFEVEIERMDGSLEADKLQELMDLSALLAERFALIGSPGTKYQQGLQVIARNEAA